MLQDRLMEPLKFTKILLSKRALKLNLAIKIFMEANCLESQGQIFFHFMIGIHLVLFEELMFFQKLFIGLNLEHLLLLLLKINFI